MRAFDLLEDAQEKEFVTLSKLSASGCRASEPSSSSNVDPQNPQSPKSGIALTGSVTADIFDQETSLVCILRGPPNAFGTQQKINTPHPVYISNAIDNLPYNRQMVAIQKIQNIDSDHKSASI
jgi:hypothetical protein